AETLLDTGTTIAGEALEYPESALPQVIAQIVTIAPGQTTGWHRHGAPLFGYILSGRLEVEYAGLGRRTLGPGDRLMEAVKTAHNGTNLEAEPVRILTVFMGAQGKPTTMKADPPPMLEQLAEGRRSELVELAPSAPALRLDLRYATTNNFTGRVVYPAARAFLQRPAAEALRRVSERARSKGLGLLVLDAYRPWSVTRMFWDSFPTHRAYLADPLEGSRHNRGCAVDLTLFEIDGGNEVKMPSGYDDFSERAHPHYAGGTAAQRASRDLLRELMEAEGFTVYENEWWHFDYQGWREYPVLDVAFEDAAAAGAH
ncbi:MAG: M15 family metallopeptidase, partial [Candidatus Binatia bacterium]